MAAGHDTSANVLSWSLLVMAEHQDIQSSLRNEINSLFRNSTAPAYNQIDELKYLDNFIKETLRVYSPGKEFISIQRGMTDTNAQKLRHTTNNPREI